MSTTAKKLLVRLDRGDHIAHIRMNAPLKLNVLSDGMLDALQHEFDSVDESVRVIILSGEGKAFCAGHDLQEMMEKQKINQTNEGRNEYYRSLFRKCSLLMKTIQSMPQPIIAQVHGAAAAAGCQLVAACDLAVASSEARFGVQGINIGLFCSTPMVAVTRAMTSKKFAFEMLTTGRMISAAEALTMGLVNRVVPANEDLSDATYELAETIAQKPPSAIRLGKQAFYKQANMSTEDAYTCTSEAMIENLALRDTQEGIVAFLEKRPPDWS